MKKKKMKFDLKLFSTETARDLSQTFQSIHTERKFRLKCLHSKKFLKQNTKNQHEHESCCKNDD